VVAVKDNGEQVGIELEYRSRNAVEDYRVLRKKDRDKTEKYYERDIKTGKYVSGEWKEVGNTWNFVYQGETKLSDPQGWHSDRRRRTLEWTSAALSQA